MKGPSWYRTTLECLKADFRDKSIIENLKTYASTRALNNSGNCVEGEIKAKFQSKDDDKVIEFANNPSTVLNQVAFPRPILVSMNCFNFGNMYNILIATTLLAVH